jgi:hypothetical protein
LTGVARDKALEAAGSCWHSEFLANVLVPRESGLIWPRARWPLLDFLICMPPPADYTQTPFGLATRVSCNVRCSAPHTSAV